MMNRDGAGPDRDATQPTVPTVHRQLAHGGRPNPRDGRRPRGRRRANRLRRAEPASVTKVTGGRDWLAETLGVRPPVLLQETKAR